MIKQITIIGVGLIGGSFALAAKKVGFQGKILGCDSDLVLEKYVKSYKTLLRLSYPNHYATGFVAPVADEMNRHQT